MRYGGGTRGYLISVIRWATHACTNPLIDHVIYTVGSPTPGLGKISILCVHTVNTRITAAAEAVVVVAAAY